MLLLCGLAETSHSVHTGCHALQTKLVEELSENNYREEGQWVWDEDEEYGDAEEVSTPQ